MPGIDESLLEAMRLPGARGALVVDWISGLALGAVGEAPGDDPEATAAETAELARLAMESGTLAPGDTSVLAPAGKEPPVQDLILTTADAYHLLRFVITTFDSTVFLYLWLDRVDGNLALARIRLADMADRLVLG
ncbi:hypothetical protein G3I31_26520 [Streptomyces sp. SID9913]|uniref:Roadblock/LC7 domain-containing protein n=2 Tax=unclassified Streptomyces TaxID=2593676 RepID=A0A6G3QML8_9ACTN|nr:hypothetical protein [Streptomyces sp. H28]MBD9734505.1 hypothetical protein [Streptomyces sp. H28]NEA84753.1 hypothetical protein [Streptomyces sp. SID14436]NEC80621.1 hypothetical protein [Streptomyces sp. SID7958]NED21572.1 hypothetical protein [Streptomyces sp. SID9913]